MRESPIYRRWPMARLSLLKPRSGHTRVPRGPDLIAPPYLTRKAENLDVSRTGPSFPEWQATAFHSEKNRVHHRTSLLGDSAN